MELVIIIITIIIIIIIIINSSYYLVLKLLSRYLFFFNKFINSIHIHSARYLTYNWVSIALWTNSKAHCPLLQCPGTSAILAGAYYYFVVSSKYKGQNRFHDLIPDLCRLQAIGDFGISSTVSRPYLKLFSLKLQLELMAGKILNR